jgi:hypothetical protein
MADCTEESGQISFARSSDSQSPGDEDIAIKGTGNNEAYERGECEARSRTEKLLDSYHGYCIRTANDIPRQENIVSCVDQDIAQDYCRDGGIDC